MKELFYLFTAAVLMYELKVLSSPKRYLELLNGVKKISKEKKEGLEVKLTRKQSLFLLFNSLYLIWGFIGLMTFNWVIFLVLLILSIIPTKHYLQCIFDSLITISLLIFAFINTFHLKINLYEFILSLF